MGFTFEQYQLLRQIESREDSSILVGTIFSDSKSLVHFVVHEVDKFLNGGIVVGGAQFIGNAGDEKIESFLFSSHVKTPTALVLQRSWSRCSKVIKPFKTLENSKESILA